ncbi:DUF11 domain-containing protein [Salinibacterium sp. ZJ70]|uniref:DUF11 domain-containing protein n=1 Tax=Salinibacterium sp. ZJ70 TaxID=2708084 RepID=UPI00141D85AF|nr:DUF11 domain-containing protein [Salinibacterium sp. ZJ70]
MTSNEITRARARRRERARQTTRKGIASGLSALLLGGLLAAVPATSASAAAFTRDEAVVYLAQGNDNDDTQLMRGLQSNGEISFSNIGGPHLAAPYNAIAFNEQDGYLYGVRQSLGAGAKVIRIETGGAVSVIKDASVPSVIGTFGDTANRFYYFSQSTMYYTNVANPSGPTTEVTLTNPSSATIPPDLTFADGFFWGYGGGGDIVRIGPLGGVTKFTVPALVGHPAAGGAFTYGNGNLGFSKNAGGILQVKVTNPASASPTFTLVSAISGPGSSANDATASRGKPADLAITKSASVTEAARGQSFTYTLRVRNNGAGVSSGFTVSDSIPSALEIGSLPTGCSANGQVVTCSGGRLTVDSTTTFTIPVTVRGTASRGTIANTASVLGNEQDAVASNNSSTADVRILVPSMTFTKTAAVVGGGDAALGGQIAYTFVVTNTGDLPISGVSVSDPLVTGIAPASATIPVGGSQTFTSTPLSVTQTHVDSGAVVNTASVTGTAAGQTLTATSSATVAIPARPGLTSLKTAALQDANGNGVADEGETIEYTIRVENTGNVTLTDVGVDDPKLPGLTATVVLAPGAVHEFVGVHTVTGADLAAGEVVNSATATGTPPGGTQITTPPTTTTTQTAEVGITLVKSAEWSGQAANTPASEGTVVTYYFVVTNTGNVPLEGVTVSDPMLVGRGTLSPAAADIAPGGQQVFTATLEVEASDIIAGVVANEATATGTPVGGTPVTSAPSTTTIPLAAAEPALALAKTAVLNDTNGNGFADVGEQIEYRLVTTNTGNVSLFDVTVDDPMFTTGQLTPSSHASLRPGAQGVSTATYTVTQTDVDAGIVSNTATATVPDPRGGGDLTATSTAEVDTAPAAPGLTLLKTSELVDANANGVADEGEEITYRFVARNTGNVTLTNVTVDDPMFPAPPAIELAATLAPGASAEASRTYTVLAQDLGNGDLVNTAVARATPPTGTEVTSEPSSTSTETVEPGLAITKSASLFDVDGSGAAGIGETITYTFRVQNTGNTRLENVRVLDDRVASVSPASITLEPQTEYAFTAAYLVTEADILAGSIVNVAAAEGTVPGSDEPLRSPEDSATTDTDPVIEALAITKLAELNDVNGNTLADLGETISYSFLLENRGNVTLTGITIEDPRVTGLGGAFDLAPGERRTVTAAPYTVVQADIDAGEVANTATANGVGPGGTVPSDPSTVVVPAVPSAPALTLVKSVEITGAVNDNGVADTTEVLTYTFVVTNTGNVTLDAVAIDDPMLSGIASPDSGPLAPGASRTFSADYVVTAADVSSPNGDGAIVNTAHATAEAPDGTPVASSLAAASVPVADPGLLIEKTASFADANGNGMADVGETVTFAFLVTNTGNVALTDIDVVDERLDVVVPVGLLAAGASATVTTSYVVTEADTIAQELVNSAQAIGVIPGTPPTPVTSPESVTSVPLGADRAELGLEKTAVLDDADGDGLASVGDTIEYRFSIVNVGNRTVTGIEIQDQMIEAELPAGLASLAPGESALLSAVPYTVRAGDFSDGVVRNVAMLRGTAPEGPISSVPSTATVASVQPEPDPVRDWLADTGAQIRTPLSVALLALGAGALLLAARAWRARTE